MAEYRVVLADEHNLFLEGLEHILNSNESPSYKIIAKVNTGKDLISIVQNSEIDAVIFDIDFVDYEPEDLISQIRTVNEKVKLLVLTSYVEMKLVKSCFRLGIDGYLLKSSGTESLFDSLNKIFSGEIYVGENIQLSPDLNGKNKPIKNSKKKMASIDRFLIRRLLTKREKEILRFIRKGLSKREIAELLFISENTVSVHKKHVMKKLKTNNTNDLLNLIEEFNILVK